MTTKQGINDTLKLIGQNGFDGLSVSAASPLLALDRLLSSTPSSNADKTRILAELKRQQLATIKTQNGRVHFTISPDGARRLQALLIDEIDIPPIKKWDGKWRMVTFDVPVAQSKQRSLFTDHLKRMHFMMLQKSLWVHPAPCFEQVERIASHLNLLRYCTLMEVSKMDDISTKRLTQRFNAELK